jgi:hypothetical protein
MPVRLLLAALVLLAVPLVDDASAAPTIGALVVRVYDAAHVPVRVQSDALRMAEVIVRTAGVEVIWVACGDTAARCTSPLRAGEAAVRFVRPLPTPGPLRGTRPATSLVALGDTLIDRDRAAGVLATIYCDRVEALALDAHVDVTLLLARAIAHEIGHLLLASVRHDATGLMRSVWRREELMHNRPADWVFTPADVKMIQVRLQPDPTRAEATTSRDAARRQARSLPRSPSSSSGAAGSDAGWSDTLPLQ